MNLKIASVFFNNRSLGYASRMVVGCIIVWWTLHLMGDTKKLFALISVIVVTDPDQVILRDATISRIINTVMGCLLGLLFVYLSPTFWSMMAAISVSVFISTSFKKYPASWKLAPVTVTLVMMSAITERVGWREDFGIALGRTAEILYGSAIAFLIGLIFSFLQRKREKIISHPKAHVHNE